MPYPYPWNKVENELIVPSGALRNAIRIRSQGTTQDSFGGPSTGGWTTVLSCFAAINTRRTGEQFESGFVSQVVHTVTIRWPGPSVPILPNMQVVVDPVPGGQSSYYIVQAVENVQQRNRIVRLTCLEIDNSKVAT